jgi:hypothetical protein
MHYRAHLKFPADSADQLLVSNIALNYGKTLNSSLVPPAKVI